MLIKCLLGNLFASISYNEFFAEKYNIVKKLLEFMVLLLKEEVMFQLSWPLLEFGLMA